MEETTLAIILTFVAVFLILQIILFFKIWMMTNNIEKIKNELTKSDDLYYARMAYIQGNSKIVKKYLQLSLEKALLLNKEVNKHSKSALKYGVQSIEKELKPVYKELDVEFPNLLKDAEM